MSFAFNSKPRHFHHLGNQLFCLINHILFCILCIHLYSMKIKLMSKEISIPIQSCDIFCALNMELSTMTSKSQEIFSGAIS